MMNSFGIPIPESLSRRDDTPEETDSDSEIETEERPAPAAASSSLSVGRERDRPSAPLHPLLTTVIHASLKKSATGASTQRLTAFEYQLYLQQKVSLRLLQTAGSIEAELKKGK